MRNYADVIAIIIVIISFVILAEASKLQRTQLWPSTARLQPSDKIEDPHIKKQFTQIKQWADKLESMLDDTFRKIAEIPYNQSESLTVADSGTVDTEFSVTHHLGRTPAGFIVTKSDAACSVYDSGTTWTTTTLYLKCDAANVALTLTVF